MAHSSPFHGLNALIETYGMIPPGSTVLCACSGGADSVYLLHRLYLLRERMVPSGCRPLQPSAAGGGIPAGRSIRPPLRRPVVRPRPGGRA